VSTVLADLWADLARIQLGIETRRLARLFVGRRHRVEAASVGGQCMA